MYAPDHSLVRTGDAANYTKVHKAYLASLSINSFACLISSSHSKSRGKTQWKFPSPTCPTIGAKPNGQERQLNHGSKQPTFPV